MTEGGRVALVLSGGIALGAYQAGAYEALHDGGPAPGWIVGTSTGALNGAIIAGNPPERRVESLRGFWDALARADTPLPFPSWPGADGFMSVARARLFGCPPLFVPSSAAPTSLWPGLERRPGLYDLAPLKATLERFLDFDLLNDGPIRVSVVATDLETGEKVVFDTVRRRIGPEHLIASSAFLPDFRPVEVEGRLLGDGGLRANLPVEVVLEDVDSADMLCIAVDLFGIEGELPGSVAAGFDRREELLLASQSHGVLDAHRRIHELRRKLARLAASVPGHLRDAPEIKDALAEGSTSAVTVLHVVRRGDRGKGLLGLYDFSASAIGDRWQAGLRDMGRALQVMERDAALPREPRLSVHGIGEAR